MSSVLKNLNRGYRNLDVWNEAVGLSVRVRRMIRNLTSVIFKGEREMKKFQSHAKA